MSEISWYYWWLILCKGKVQTHPYKYKISYSTHFFDSILKMTEDQSEEIIEGQGEMIEDRGGMIEDWGGTILA